MGEDSFDLAAKLYMSPEGYEDEHGNWDRAYWSEGRETVLAALRKDRSKPGPSFFEIPVEPDPSLEFVEEFLRRLVNDMEGTCITRGHLR